MKNPFKGYEWDKRSKKNPFTYVPLSEIREKLEYGLQQTRKSERTRSVISKEEIEKFESKITTISNEEAWEIVLWSFYYSRGDGYLQILLLEYFRRKFKLQPDFNPKAPDADVIKKSISFRKGPIHDKHNQGGSEEYLSRTSLDLFEKYSPFLSGDIEKINSYRRSLLDPQMGDSQLYHLVKEMYSFDTETLKYKIVENITSVDETWKIRKNSERSNFLEIQSFLNNGKKIPGGKPYDDLWVELKERFGKVVI
jgi:hypothetical protein